jgi:hypothetical protein
MFNYQASNGHALAAALGAQRAREEEERIRRGGPPLNQFGPTTAGTILGIVIMSAIGFISIVLACIPTWFAPDNNVIGNICTWLIFPVLWWKLGSRITKTRFWYNLQRW